MSPSSFDMWMRIWGRFSNDLVARSASRFRPTLRGLAPRAAEELAGGLSNKDLSVLVDWESHGTPQL